MTKQLKSFCVAVSLLYLLGGTISKMQAEDASKPTLDLPIADGPFKPTMDSLAEYKCPQWFQDAKFGIWAHWGPQAVPMEGDWYARKIYQQGSHDYNYHIEHYGHPSTFGYKDIIPLWKAEKWDPDHLMSLYKKAGAILCEHGHPSRQLLLMGFQAEPLERSEHGSEPRCGGGMAKSCS